MSDDTMFVAKMKDVARSIEGTDASAMLWAASSYINDLRARLEKAEAALKRLSAHWPFTEPLRKRAKVVHIPSCAFDFIEDQLCALKDKS